jgi:hypothetical protein
MKSGPQNDLFVLLTVIMASKLLANVIRFLLMKTDCKLLTTVVGKSIASAF